jgi:hypothetical protein
MDDNTKNGYALYVLGVLQVFIGITATIGGFGLVSDPSGTKMHVALDLLKKSPFTDFLIPGLVLLIVNGACNVLAGIATFLRNRYAGNLAVFLGAFLVLYITVEVLVIGLVNFSQPLYFILGVAELIFGLKLVRWAKTAHRIWIESPVAKLPT